MNNRWSERPEWGVKWNPFRRLIISIAITCLGLALAATASASDQLGNLSGEKIDWNVMAGGGTPGSSGSYQLDGTMGQAIAGPGSSADNNLNAGFWQVFSAPCQGRCGNANNDPLNKVNVADASYIISFVFVPGSPGPQPVYNCGNANGSVDGGLYKVNVSDATFIINFVFVPGSPFPNVCASETYANRCCDY